MDNPKDDESRSFIMRHLFAAENIQLMIDAEFTHGRYGIVNFTFMPDGLAIMSYSCLGKYRVDWFDVLTAEKAQEKIDELQCIQAALVQSKDGKLRCSRCGTVIQPYHTCSTCGWSWKTWLDVKLAPIRAERQKQEQEKSSTEDTLNSICFNFSEEEE
ncbi:MAG: hypothetical protein Q7R92_04410 [bacterium]|nr:hypothetical protein [bacterium]